MSSNQDGPARKKQKRRRRRKLAQWRAQQESAKPQTATKQG